MDLFFQDFINDIDKIVLALILPLTLAYWWFGLDDLFIDFWAFFKKLKPQFLSDDEWAKIQALEEKPLAIMVANWKEFQVLERMVMGNLSRIDYKNYHFFLGVYPNDLTTAQVAQSLEKLFPEKVHVVVNSLVGPTNKGQMLNEIVKGIHVFEKKMSFEFAAYIIHDSEDLIHPRSLKIYNSTLAEGFGFVQIPVFPITPKLSEYVCGSYADEFSESHTKDMLVRVNLTKTIPSAGVSTAFSHGLISSYLKQHDGRLMDKVTLTEDYELGLRVRAHGFKAQFVSRYFYNELGEKEFIATREFFPRTFASAIKQKSRWTLGIAFQGFENLGWQGNWIYRYFLYRDRKGPIANLLTIIGLFLFLYILVRGLVDPSFEILLKDHLNVVLGSATILFMVNRIIQRMIASYRVYRFKLFLLVPFRILISNWINAFAALKATRQYFDGKIKGVAPAWAKTHHELPPNFGIDSPKIGAN